MCAMLALQSRSIVPVRFFLIYLLLEAFSFSCEWLMNHPATPYKGLWLTGIMSVSFFIAPCLWLYARELSERASPRIKTLASFHWYPIVAGQILLLPLLSSVHAGTVFPNTLNPLSSSYALFIHSTMLAAVVVFLVQTLVYLRGCIAILNQRVSQNRSLFAQTADPALNTLRVLIIAVFTNWLVSAMRTLYCLTIGSEIGLGVVFSGIELAIVSYIIYSTFKQEQTYKPDEQAVRDGLYPTPVRGRARTATSGVPKYARSNISDAQRHTILKKLEQSMTRDRLFRDSDLSLRRLCEHIDETPHAVSQVINESEHDNFFEMINRHRIEEAKRELLADPANSVLNVAYDVGYNSKSTFNAAFRKITGMTPTQFRACNNPSTVSQA